MKHAPFVISIVASHHMRCHKKRQQIIQFRNRSHDECENAFDKYVYIVHLLHTQCDNDYVAGSGGQYGNCKKIKKQKTNVFVFALFVT